MFVKGIGYFIASIWLLQLAATNAEDERVVGGQYTTIDHVPSLVQIGKDGQFICGGSLLTKQFVVSAAHCYVGVEPDQLRVVGGATRLSDTGVPSNVTVIMLYDNYDDKTKDNDVAVLKLEDPLKGENIGFIELYRGPLHIGMKVVVFGWGYITEKDYRPSDQVKTATVTINDWEKCVTDYRKIVNVTENMFCASNPGIDDACTGDSGGPGLINGQLAGIVSVGYGCGRKEYSGVYTNVQKVHDFIAKCLQT